MSLNYERSGMRVGLRSGALVTAAAVGTTVWVGYTATHQPSETYKTIEADRSWLAYLPPGDTGLDLTVVGLNFENGAGVESRRVDLADSTHHKIASLCFAETEKAVLRACPGTTFLGVASRSDMDLPAVAQLNPDGTVDWLKYLGDPTPRLDDLDYVE
jgi:hypothetical protein